MTERQQRIAKQLDWLVEKEILRTWQCQGDMPGLRWHIEGFTFSTRALTTSGIEDFLLGANEAWEAARIAGAV